MIGLIFWSSIFLIIYTYFLYPLVLWGVTALIPRRVYHGVGECPSVTLLIAAYNEAESISAKIENSLKLDYPPDRLQILVAADGSDDATVSIVESFNDPRVVLCFRPERQGKMAAINRAMTHSTGEIVVFSDANNIYATDTLRQLIRAFDEPSVGAVSGAKRILKGDSPLGQSEGLYWRYESFIKERESRLGCCTGVCGEILALRRALFIPPPATIINDDFALAMGLIHRGYQIRYAPEAKSYEQVSGSASDEIARRARIIAGRYQAIASAHQWLPFKRPLLVWEIISHKIFRPLVPLAMLAALLTNAIAVLSLGAFDNPQSPLLSLAWPYSLGFLIGQIFFYVMAFWRRVHPLKGKIGALLYLPTFLVDSNLAALMGLKRYLFNAQSTTWSMAKREPLHLAAIERLVEDREKKLDQAR